MLESSSRNKLTSEGKSRNKTQTNKKRKMIVLENICSKTKHQSPCQPMQQWECVTVDGRPRLRKCRKTGSVQATTTPTTRPQLSTAPTTPVKMCVCMKPRPGTQRNENQGDMYRYNGEWNLMETQSHDILELISTSVLSKIDYASNFKNRTATRSCAYPKVMHCASCSINKLSTIHA